MLYLFSVWRMMHDFGENVGMKPIMVILVSFLAIFIVPKASAAMFFGMLDWWNEDCETATKISDLTLFLRHVDIQADGWLDVPGKAIALGALMFARALVGLWDIIRGLAIVALSGGYILTILFCPIFMAMFTISETKTIAVRYLMSLFSLIVMPISLIAADGIGWWVFCTGYNSFGLETSWNLKKTIVPKFTVDELIANVSIANQYNLSVGGAFLLLGLMVGVIVCVALAYMMLPRFCYKLFAGGEAGNPMSFGAGLIGGAAASTAASARGGMEKMKQKHAAVGIAMHNAGVSAALSQIAHNTAPPKKDDEAGK